MNPDYRVKDHLVKTEIEEKGGIKCTTFYISRPIQQGDPHGGSIGYTTADGKEITTDFINYIYSFKD